MNPTKRLHLTVAPPKSGEALRCPNVQCQTKLAESNRKGELWGIVACRKCKVRVEVVAA